MTFYESIMDWQTLFDYRLDDLIMFSPEVYEALHHSYLQQYALMQWCFWLLLLVQVIWLVQYRMVLEISLALIWAWLAYQYTYQTLGQVLLAGGQLAGILAIQSFIHLLLALVSPAGRLKPRLLHIEQKRSVKLRIGLVVAGLAPWQAIVTGQSSLSVSYGLGILPTAIVTIGFAQLFYTGWCRWLALSIPVLCILAILVLLFGLY